MYEVRVDKQVAIWLCRPCIVSLTSNYHRRISFFLSLLISFSFFTCLLGCTQTIHNFSTYFHSLLKYFAYFLGWFSRVCVCRRCLCNAQLPFIRTMCTFLWPASFWFKFFVIHFLTFWRQRMWKIQQQRCRRSQWMKFSIFFFHPCYQFLNSKEASCVCFLFCHPWICGLLVL